MSFQIRLWFKVACETTNLDKNLCILKQEVQTAVSVERLLKQIKGISVSLYGARRTYEGAYLKEKNKKKKRAPTVGTGEWPTAERFTFITFLFERMVRGWYSSKLNMTLNQVEICLFLQGTHLCLLIVPANMHYRYEITVVCAEFKFLDQNCLYPALCIVDSQTSPNEWDTNVEGKKKE